MDPRPWIIRRLRLDFAGLTVAAACAVLSLTPSLLPRTWLFQGIVTGVVAAIGYAFGVLASWLVRQTASPKPGATLKRHAWWELCTGGALVLGAAVVGHARIRYPVAGGSEDPWARVALVPVGIVVFLGLIHCGRSVVWLTGVVERLLRRVLPAGVAAALAVLTVVPSTVLVLRDGVAGTALSVADASFRSLDRAVTGSPPDPGSLIGWDTLGGKGREFVANTPTAARIEQVTGRTAIKPIRVYAGLDSAPTARDRAALAVRELDRTGAFGRAVLCVATTTGTGWIDERAAGALEYLHGGDTAEVAIQYSYLPSWLSFLVDGRRAQEAGRELFAAVRARWAQLPPEHRPKLVVFGESLGSYGGESAFLGPDDVRRHTDGVLWVGPPHANALAGQYRAGRDPGSTAAAPVVDGGREVRFADGPDDLRGDLSGWAFPRVLYLQHATDPVVWWDPALLTEEPDWLAEHPGRGVPDGLRWYPVVTFWQLTVDLLQAQSVPDGYGHRYGPSMVHAWAAIAPPAGWTPADVDRLAATPIS
ncbi:alpha/beta hydrolase [Longispora fulva]|uniref:Putative membrane protein n=1 Tax=Longispora fulva TaxID=619741 RepID=A0A8J7GJ54_9ACTN|nr:alpha/beta hydrolase [Longispora fulva]MBG6138490.1 putative membrane protein [Longispora fulva]